MKLSPFDEAFPVAVTLVGCSLRVFVLNVLWSVLVCENGTKAFRRVFLPLLFPPLVLPLDLLDHLLQLTFSPIRQVESCAPQDLVIVLCCCCYYPSASFILSLFTTFPCSYLWTSYTYTHRENVRLSVVTRNNTDGGPYGVAVFVWGRLPRSPKCLLVLRPPIPTRSLLHAPLLHPPTFLCMNWSRIGPADT